MKDSVLEHEIREQPECVARLIREETENVAAISDALRGRFRYVVIAARGSSDNAARYGQYLLGARNRINVSLATPSLFTIYQKPPSLEGALVIGISQSGQSPDVRSVLVEANRQGRPTLAITNDPASPLAEVAGHVIALHAGPERAVAATKTYTASLAALAILSSSLAARPSRRDPLEKLPELMRISLESAHEAMEAADLSPLRERCVVIGRGLNFGTAFEIALKLKELSQIVAEPYSSADFLHGPIAMVEQDFPVILISPRGAVHPDLVALAAQLRELEAHAIVISDDPALLNQASMPLPLPAGIPEWLSPIPAVVPGQILALHLARALGLDPDDPRGIHKVTKTW